MSSTDNHELITAALSVVHPHLAGDRLLGDVGSALETAQGDRFLGVCLDTSSGTGFCAEASAIAAMVTAGQYEIRKIVAVWRSEDGEVHVLPPCGRCREFIRQVDEANLETEVVLGADTTLPLRDLLPRYEWPGPI